MKLKQADNKLKHIFNIILEIFVVKKCCSTYRRTEEILVDNNHIQIFNIHLFVLFILSFFFQFFFK